MPKQEIETFCPTSRQDLRRWLEENHLSKPAVWLVLYRKKAGVPSVSWSELVDEALCFGWIDSVRRTIDNERFMQFLSPRKPKGTWSKINKEKIIQLSDAGLMTEAGLQAIERAKQNGSWSTLDAVEDMIIPADLADALEANIVAGEYFQSLSKSSKKIILYWLGSAKQTETRQKRLGEIIESANERMKPKPFR
ncbi:hypothetical protein EGI26_10110 [Lacihabitans sp. CCS-44]|uniref:YdeI/OmpD-associated family protein n=1 Tax=Lacihabitans sp. CCS-44 TaxID=2487331 RepID=UPI0020CC73D5|nr:YdeI/OmpD-associated family protein [Lacihabitans sp. CCS-44]MCP9755508.1 hypothetical protein [Lacihabitans sp. CCS-44]